MNRWFAWVKKTETIQKFGSVLLLILMYIGRTSNMYGTLADLTLFGGKARLPSVAQPTPSASASSTSAPASSPASSSSTAPAASARPAPQPSDAVRMSVKDCNIEVEKLRRSCVNTIHMASCVLANHTSRKVLAIMRLTAAPFERAHGSQVVACTTQRGVLQWHAAMSNSEFGHLSEAFGLLSSPCSLDSIGFLRHDSYLAKDDEAKLEDSRLAETMLDLLRFLVGNELLSLLFYAHRPLGRFAGFLHDEVEVRSATMVWCRRLWKTLEAAEEAATGDSWLLSFLQGLGWTSETWTREVLVACAEAWFTEMAPDVLEELRQTFRCCGTTTAVEDSFGHLRDAERQSKVGALSVQARWHRCVTSRILEECDRPPPPILGIDKAAAAAPALPKSMFYASTCGFSLGADTLDSIRGNHRSWQTASPQAFERITMATQASLV